MLTPRVARSLPWILLVSGVLLAIALPPADGPAVSRGEVPPGFSLTTFGVLAGYEWEPEGLPALIASRGRDGIPPKVLQLDGRAVFIKGFMLPLESSPNGVTSFLLNAAQDMCYFGAPTRPNDWILVRMADGTAVPFTHGPVAVWGRLQVGAELREGRVTSLYRIFDASARSDEP